MSRATQWQRPEVSLPITLRHLQRPSRWTDVARPWPGAASPAPHSCTSPWQDGEGCRAQAPGATLAVCGHLAGTWPRALATEGPEDKAFSLLEHCDLWGAPHPASGSTRVDIVASCPLLWPSARDEDRTGSCESTEKPRPRSPPASLPVSPCLPQPSLCPSPTGLQGAGVTPQQRQGPGPQGASLLVSW